MKLPQSHRTYAVERQSPVVRRFPTPDESGNYSRSTIKKPVKNNDRCSLLKGVTPISVNTKESDKQ